MAPFSQLLVPSCVHDTFAAGAGRSACGRAAIRDGRARLLPAPRLLLPARRATSAVLSTPPHLHDNCGQQHADEEHERLKLVEVEVEGLAQGPRQHDAKRHHQHTNLRAAACVLCGVERGGVW